MTNTQQPEQQSKLKTKLQRWLGIKNYDKSLTAAVKSFEDTFKDKIRELEAEMWKHRHLLQKRAITKCPGCNKSLKLWPLETEAYYTRDGQAYHVKCYNKPASKKPESAS